MSLRLNKSKLCSSRLCAGRLLEFLLTAIHETGAMTSLWHRLAHERTQIPAIPKPPHPGY